MSPGLAPVCLALLLALMAELSWSAAIYRCGNQYRDRPCEDSVPLEIDDAPGDARLREAAGIARREAALADRLAADRERAWARRPAGAAGIVHETRRELRSALSPKRETRPRRDRPERRESSAAEDADFIAVDPDEPPHRRKRSPAP